MGYHNAGFEVVGIDIKTQPKYPFEFHQGDAVGYAKQHWQEFDAIHASPPCQAHTSASKQWREEGKVYDCYIEETRAFLQKTGLPYVIENVPNSPLVDPIILCGSMFGLKTYRHRLFESNCTLYAPNHPEHVHPQAKMGRVPKEGEFIQVVGHFSGVPFAQKAMGIPWLGQKELAQAIPPAYTEFIGWQIRAAMMIKMAA